MAQTAEQILIKMVANTQEALQQWKIATQGPEGMGDALEKTARRGKRAATDMEKVWDRVATRWVSISTGINLASSAVRMFREETARLRGARAETTVELNAVFRDLFLQMGLERPGDKPTRDRIQEMIFNTATRTGVPNVQFAAEAAKQLESIGFPRTEMIDKGGMETFMRFLQVTTAARPDVQPGQLAEALGGFIVGAGLPQDAASLKKVAVAVATLFRTTPIQTAHLEKLSGQAGAIREFGGVSFEDQLSLFSAVKKVQPEAEVATGFRNFVLRLAAPQPSAVKGMQELGIDPESVNFEGEEIGDIIGTFNRARKGKRAPEFAQAMRKIFGQRTITTAMAILNAEDLFNQYRADVAAGGGRFESLADFAAQGPAADANRAFIRQQKVRIRPEEARAERIRKDVATEGERGGDIAGMLSRFTFWLAREFHVDPDTAARWALGGRPPTAGLRGRAAENVINPPLPQRIEIELRDADRNAIPAEVDAAQLAP